MCFVCLDSHHTVTLFLEVEANSDHRKKGGEGEKQERGMKINEIGSGAFKGFSTGNNMTVVVNNCA